MKNTASTVLQGLVVIVAIAWAATSLTGPDLERSDYPDRWPFTVDSVDLDCTADGLHPFVVTPNSQGLYAITGAGRSVAWLLPPDEILERPEHLQWVIDKAKAEVCHAAG